MTATEREAFIGFVSRIAKEGGLIILIACCTFLMLSLLTFDARDPGWSHLGYDGAVRNLAGVAGAWVGDFCYSGLGFFAFAPPLMIGWRALLFLRKREAGIGSALPYFTLRLLGAIFFVLAGTALASLHFGNQWLQLPFGAGGMIGLSLSSESASLFGLVGSTLVLLAFWMLGLTLFSDFSWTGTADTLGGLMLKAGERCRELLTSTGSSENTDHSVRRQEELREDTLEFFEDADETSARAAESTDYAGHSLKEPSADEESDRGVFSSLLARFSGRDQLQQPAERREEPHFDPPWSESGSESPSEPESIDSVDERPAPVEAVVSPDDALHQPRGVPSADPMASEEIEAAEKHVKIVPLSETHQPQLSEDGPAGVTAAGRKEGAISLPARRKIPSLKLLDKPEEKRDAGYSPEKLEVMSRLLEAKLKDFGVIAEVVEVNPGPVITRFEIQPAPGVKVSKISNLAKDLARSMAVLSVRVVEVIAGKSVVGIEIPNENREIVRLSEVLYADVYGKAESKLSLALGNDIAGNPVVVNLAKMPHLLVAGTTGSGKSVGVNAMLLSLLFKATPDEVRLMMVDPKMLELSIYDGIPHLLTPVITDMKEAASGLRWCVAEMERRYKLMAKLGVRNLAGFNDKIIAARAAGQPIVDPLWNPLEEGFDEQAPAPELETLPYIVVVIDEFADMMMIVGKKVEELIARIAQKARAAGIHLILATQRPSVDVITGLIKANVPTRIAFQVSSKIDSRTILDQSGAEHLLGYGDMLYLPAGTSMPVRVHGAFVADDEVHRLVEAWKKWGPAEFVEEILMESVDADMTGGASGSLFEDEQDPLYDEAVAFVTQSRRASISAVQRKLKIGYNRAARMVESMEAAGVVSEAGHNGGREVLAPPPVQG